MLLQDGKESPPSAVATDCDSKHFGHGCICCSSNGGIQALLPSRFHSPCFPSSLGPPVVLPVLASGTVARVRRAHFTQVPQHAKNCPQGFGASPVSCLTGTVFFLFTVNYCVERWGMTQAKVHQLSPFLPLRRSIAVICQKHLPTEEVSVSVYFQVVEKFSS